MKRNVEYTLNVDMIFVIRKILCKLSDNTMVSEYGLNNTELNKIHKFLDFTAADYNLEKESRGEE